jgi:hypothetical protein
MCLLHAAVFIQYIDLFCIVVTFYCRWTNFLAAALWRSFLDHQAKGGILTSDQPRSQQTDTEKQAAFPQVLGTIFLPA